MGPLHRFPVATDRMVGLSLTVNQGVEDQVTTKTKFFSAMVVDLFFVTVWSTR